eukprot:9227416-Alexandrium_andersonii.AAC.1
MQEDHNHRTGMRAPVRIELDTCIPCNIVPSSAEKVGVLSYWMSRWDAMLDQYRCELLRSTFGEVIQSAIRACSCMPQP